MKKVLWIGIAFVLVIGLASSAMAKSLKEYTYEIVDLNYQKKYQEALKLNNIALSGYPNSAELYYLRGITYDDMNNKKAALADFDKAISLNSKYDDAFHYRGMVKMDLNSFQSAYVDFTTCISLNPKNGHCYLGRGLVRLELGDINGSNKDMEYGTQLLEENHAKMMDEADKLINETDKIIEEAKNSSNK